MTGFEVASKVPRKCYRASEVEMSLTFAVILIKEAIADITEEMAEKEGAK